MGGEQHGCFLSSVFCTAAADELGYLGPDPAARALTRGSTGAVGIVLTTVIGTALTEEMATQFLQAILEGLAPTGLSLTLLSGEEAAGHVPARDVPMDGVVVSIAIENPRIGMAPPTTVAGGVCRSGPGPGGALYQCRRPRRRTCSSGTSGGARPSPDRDRQCRRRRPTWLAKRFDARRPVLCHGATNAWVAGTAFRGWN